MAAVDPNDPLDVETVTAVEYWLRPRGIPIFIDDDSATRDVFTRAVPICFLVLVLELLGARSSCPARRG